MIKRFEIADEGAKPIQGIRIGRDTGWSVQIARRGKDQGTGIVSTPSTACFRTKRWTVIVGKDMPFSVGAEIRIPDGISLGDGSRWEYRRKLQELTVCPRCSRMVEMWATTDKWDKDATNYRRWRHIAYGAPVGICCKQMVTPGTKPGRPRSWT